MVQSDLCFTITLLGVIFLLINDLTCAPFVKLRKRLIFGRTVEPFCGQQVNQYLGIRYAKPPVGELRFQKTVKFCGGPRKFEAIHMPPACLQLSNSPYPWYVNGSHKSEDCLFLNVWTPVDAGPRNQKAVLFWMHGGGFRFGSIRDQLYNGTAVSALGDIIVVTANYRLGAFGFLTTDTDGAPGNAGLWDVLEALKWVNKNIPFFGGDVTRITIAGESAGSIFVGYLSESPLAVGLFTQQIMESGSPAVMAQETKLPNLALTELLAFKVGCANDTHLLVNHRQHITDCLKRVKAEDLERAEMDLVPGATTDFLPQYGDEILPKNPRKAIFNGGFRCKKLLIGNTLDEGSVFLSTSLPEVFGFFGEKNTEINRTVGVELVEKEIKSILPDLQTAVKSPVSDNPLVKEALDIAPDIQQNILTSLIQSVYNSSMHELQTLLGDLLLVCPDEYYAEKCAEKGGDVYFYLFDHRPSITPWAPWMGVAHFEEVQFVFGKPLLCPHLYLSSEIQLSRDIILLWSSFVKTGKPDQKWPSYRQESPDFRYIGTGYSKEKYGEGPHKQTCDLFRQVSAL